jgi:2-polyprenyl-6-methoxyphenol hydroxylase-like FAD-dependent oxidoreductase
MTEILKHTSITCNFGYRLIDINYNPKQLIFEHIIENNKKSIIVVDLIEGDRVIGADGFNSMVRQVMVSFIVDDYLGYLLLMIRL